MQRKLLKKSIVSLILLLCINLSTNAYADQDNKVFMVIVNRLSLYDIEYMENLKEIIEDGSIGLMNTRGIIGYKGAESFITINSSSKAYSSYETASFFNLDSETKAIYERRTGNNVGDSSIGNVEINKLYSLNANKNYDSVIGALGENLQKNGYKTAVFGNSDTADSFVRTSCLIAMNREGLIDFGNVDDILVKDMTYPYGIKTDYEKVIEEMDKTKSKASLFIIETGDLDRLREYGTKLSEKTFSFHRQRILLDIDNFIGKLFNEIIDDNCLFLLVSPNSPDDRIDNSKLSPLVIWGSKEYKGLLTSSTTRREGIVSNIDIAPTITNFLNADSDNFVGHVIQSVDNQEKLSFIKYLNTRTNIVSGLRPKYLNFYCLFTLFTFFLLICVLFTDKKMGKGMKFIINLLSLLTVVIPLVYLVLAYFNVLDSIIYLVLFFSISITIIITIYFISEKYRLILLFSITYLILAIDLIMKGNLLKFSILSYDPIIGARYFGIGNELTGVLLAISVLITAYLMEKANGNLSFLFILFFTVIIISHPNFGANVGGTISVLFATIVFVLNRTKFDINLKRIFLTSFLVVFFIFLMGILDAFINPNPTHLGSTLLAVKDNGPKIIINVFQRKILMNIKLMGNSIWSKVLLVGILSEVFIIIKKKNFVLTLSKEYKYIFSGIISVIFGSIVGLLVNDSGVLLSAIANIYIVAVLINLSLSVSSEN